MNLTLVILISILVVWMLASGWCGLARRYGGRVKIVEPYASELPAAFEGTGAELIDIDQALETCPIMITLTDHDMFKSIPLDERASKVVYDTRGIWPDQPDNREAVSGLRLVS